MAKELETQDYLIPADKFRELIGGISETTLWRLTRKGTFPKPIRIAGRRYYRKSWVDQIVATGSCTNACANEAS